MSETPTLYRLARVAARVALGVYFRSIEVTGRERIPSRGPLIFAANHPQSISDALVLGLAAGRTVHFLAHGGLFHPRWKAWFLRQCGVIPVHRRRDVEGHAEKNVATFEACTALLAEGGSIGIFPEGTSDREKRVQRLKTGTARIALESEREYDFRLGIRVVPVGLNFESARRFRSRVLVKLGEPIVAADYRVDFERDPVDTVQLLTSALEDSLRELVVNLSRADMEPLAEDVVQIYGPDLLDRAGLGFEGRSPFQRQQEVERHVARALEDLFTRAPERVREVDEDVRRYRRLLDQSRLSDEMVREQRDPSVRRDTLRLLWLAGLGFLPGLYGLVLNWLPYKLTGKIATRLNEDPTKIHFHQLGVGTLLFLVYYPSLLYLFHRGFGEGPWPVTVFGASLLPTGLFARWYVRTLVKGRRRFRFAWLAARHKVDVQQLRSQRNLLVQHLDGLLEEYLARRRESSRAQAEAEFDPRGDA